MARQVRLIIAVILTSIAYGRNGDERSTWTSCSLYCECSLLSENVSVAKCSLPETKNFCDKFILPNDTKILDLSANHLHQVPLCLLNKSETIVSLSLARNQITMIEEGSFPRMPKLRDLDLSFNYLQQWNGEISNTLPSLSSVDLTGNDLFIPGNKLFELKGLDEVLGLSWSDSCYECHLIRNQLLINISDGEPECIANKELFSFSNEIDYGVSLLFMERGFTPICLCEQEACFSDEVGKPYNLALNTLPRKLFYIEYALGAISFVLNVIVVAIMFNSRLLRRNTSFIFIGNIAVCDVMMGVYSVLIGRYTVYEFIVNEHNYPGMDTFINDYCTAMGVIFTTAQVTAVCSSFLATFEKYLAIVHCMNPNIRLTKKTALCCLAGIWSIAIGYALLGVFKVAGLRYHGEFTCMMPFVDGPSQYDASIIGLAVAALLVLLYILSIALYARIFVQVRKAGASAGIKRNATLARNICLMVFTNCLFFMVPMISTLLFVYQFDQLIEILDINSLSDLRSYFIAFSWFPVVLLSFNSCLNPFLCAFRHPKVRAEISKCFSKCRCACLRRPQKPFPLQAFVLLRTKRLEFSSMEASKTEPAEKFTSVEVL